MTKFEATTRVYCQRYMAAAARHGCQSRLDDRSCPRCLHETLNAAAIIHAILLDARYGESPRRHEARQTWSATSDRGVHTAQADSSALYDALHRQALCLEHFAPRNVFAARVLIEHLHFVAADAKDGAVASVLQALARVRDEQRQLPARELGLVVGLEALPIAALARFTEGDLTLASAYLHAAIETAAELAGQYSHRYLTAKRLHLAINLARVEMAGRSSDAERLLDAIADVIAGDTSAWPFGGGPTLGVPLDERANRSLATRLNRERRRLADESAAFYRTVQ